MRSIGGNYWKKPSPFTPDRKLIEIAENLQLSPEIIALLRARGIEEPDKLRQFLYPTLHDVKDPFTLDAMDTACKIIADVIVRRGNLVIWGDYDVDGVTATALLYRFLSHFPITIHWFVPNRFRDGYGLNREKIEVIHRQIHATDPVLVTVDCGIGNYEEVQFAKSLGFRVIVTDHHEPGEEPVEADAVINPKKRGCLFGEEEVAGVGLAFYLALALRSFLLERNYYTSKKNIPNLKNLLELVAIGTIADMVMLNQSNRVLIKAGFEIIDSKPSPGVEALLELSDLRTGKITSEDIAFKLAPMINSAGRLDDPSVAVYLLIEENQDRALNLAKQLSELNKKRKKLCENGLERILGNENKNLFICDNVVVARCASSIGIVGILASKLVDTFGKPAVVVTEVDDPRCGQVLKGSCRSINNLNIFSALQQSADLLLQFGGHPMAAGITLLQENLEILANNLSESLLLQKQKPKYREVDLTLETEKALSKTFREQLQLLEPYGNGNPKPLFCDVQTVAHGCKRLGRNGEHLTFTRNGKFADYKCIGFGLGSYDEEIKKRRICQMIFSVSASKFKRSLSWQAQIIDII